MNGTNKVHKTEIKTRGRKGGTEETDIGPTKEIKGKKTKKEKDRAQGMKEEKKDSIIQG